MNKKIKETPQVAIKLSNIIFLFGLLFSISISVYAAYRIYNPMYVGNLGNNGVEKFYIFSIIFGIIFAILFLVGLKILSKDVKVNLSLFFFSIGVAVYGFGAYLEFSKKVSREIIAKQMGVTYDTRTYLEVLDELIESGIKVLPNVRPKKLNGLVSKKGRIYPLGTISNSTTIFHNESGYYPLIETDEHGFNNPKGLYKENEVDILLTGDSFTEGVSVHSNESIGAVLRQLNFNTLSVGKIHNGPLLELAAIKEYAEPLKPKIVLWLYFINDLNDLRMELPSSILIKYLNEDDYSQDLILRQEEIDIVLTNYAMKQLKAERLKKKDKSNDSALFKKKMIDLLKLTKIRGIINLKPSSTPPSIFRDILQKSDQMVSSWGGKMYFVYLPYYRYITGKEDADREFVMQTITELQIPIIDIHKKVFIPHSDPLSLFPLRFKAGGHYNAKGYRLIAEAIGDQLLSDGYIPIRLKK